MIKKAITYILKEDAAVQALVGMNEAQDKYKIYPIVVPQTEKAPYVSVSVIGRTVVSKGCADQWTVQVVSYATTEEGSLELHEACKTAILGTKYQTVNGFELSYMNFTTESDGFEREGNLYYKIAVYDGQ